MSARDCLATWLLWLRLLAHWLPVLASSRNLLESYLASR